MTPRTPAFLLVAFFAITLLSRGYADTVTSPVVGFTSRTVNPGDDSVFKVGFERPPIFSGRLALPPLDLGNNRLLTFNGEPLAGANSLSETHYVKAIDGSGAGGVYEITSNRSDEVTVAVGRCPLPSPAGIGSRSFRAGPWLL